MSDRILYLTEQDMRRLRELTQAITSADSTHQLALSDELERVEIVSREAIPPNVVTMNSKVIYEDLETGSQQEVTVVFPEDADPARNKVSVLAPLGAALIGLSTGQEISWPVPNGKALRLRVIEVPFQPEAAWPG